VSPVPGVDFGHSVAVSGTTAVVGAPEAAGGQGAVYVYSKVGRSWRLTKTLVDPDHRHLGDFFGYAVAINGTTIAVGAPEENSRHGAVYLYRKFKRRNDWYSLNTLYDPLSRTGQVDMTFGASVALAGNTLVVGAPGTKNNAGVAYVYTPYRTRRVRIQSLALPTGEQGDNFGYSVAIADGTILIGAPGRTLGTRAKVHAAGAAYVFGQPHGSAWRLAKPIDDPSRATSNDSFGFSVSLTADTAVIGAPGRSTSRGAAYIYAHRGRTGWHKPGEITDPNKVAGDNFGDAVSLAAGAAVIGASYATGTRGAVYVARYRENKHHRRAWSLSTKIPDPVRDAGDYFGSSVGVSSGVAVVGAVGTNDSAGAAYILTRSKQTLKWPGVAGAAGYQLKFNPSFSGTQLDTKVWGTCYPWISKPGLGCTNHGDGEVQWYLPSQVHVSNGELHLVAKRAKTIGTTKTGQRAVYYCRSGMVTTYPDPRSNFKYGVVQVVANISGQNHMWPAFWLAASNTSWPPEIDMFEHYFGQPRTTGLFIHYGPRKHSQKISGWPFTANLAVGSHTYTLIWTAKALTFFIDGRAVLITRQHVPQQPMYFVADLAEQKGAHGVCSGYVELRSVKIWQN
jgi:hypothetical protein